LRPQTLELGGVLEKLDDFLQLALRLFHARHVVERIVLLGGREAFGGAADEAPGHAPRPQWIGRSPQHEPHETHHHQGEHGGDEQVGAGPPVGRLGRIRHVPCLQERDQLLVFFGKVGRKLLGEFFSGLFGVVGGRQIGVIGRLLPFSDDLVFDKHDRLDVARVSRLELTAEETVADLRPAAARIVQREQQRHDDDHGDHEHPRAAGGRARRVSPSGALGGLRRRRFATVGRKPGRPGKIEKTAHPRQVTILPCG
jgi:hypothetical protein